MILDEAGQLIPVSIRESFRNIFEKMREKSMVKFFSQFIDKGSLVFDVGANIGDYAEIFLKCGAKVVCIDPHPICIQKLKKRFKNNPNIIIVEKGLAEKEGEMELFIDKNNHATSTFSDKFKTIGPFKNRKWDQKVSVQVTTLNNLINIYGVPKFCKIDTEGFEMQVLGGLNHPIPFLCFEYALEMIDETSKCMDYLQKIGDTKFNFSSAYTTTKLELKIWTDNKEEILEKIKKTPLAFLGDIFVKIN